MVFIGTINPRRMNGGCRGTCRTLSNVSRSQFVVLQIDDTQVMPIVYAGQPSIHIFSLQDALGAFSKDVQLAYCCWIRLIRFL